MLGIVGQARNDGRISSESCESFKPINPDSDHDERQTDIILSYKKNSVTNKAFANVPLFVCN
jgi:hypothetical protein